MNGQILLDFWFDDETQKRWFDATPEFDQLCQDRFGSWIEPAAKGDLDHWTDKAETCLALIILLDQLTRNIYRSRPEAFACDPKALAIANHAIAQGFDRQMSELQRPFIYLPLEHSEDLDDQARSVELFKALGDPLKLDYAIRHQKIIERFGRFPHRNAILGRESTADELEFLKEPGSSF